MSANRHVAQNVAAGYGLPGVPVSMRDEHDLPRTGVGTGHWARRARALATTVDRARRAMDATPPGGLRDELDRVHDLLDRRLTRLTRIAEIGHALQPDDDTTTKDGTHPGDRPLLRGAAIEIDQRLTTAAGHLSTLATAVERLAATLAASGPDAVVDGPEAAAVRAELDTLRDGEG
jgi:hypothetical protein